MGREGGRGGRKEMGGEEEGREGGREGEKGRKEIVGGREEGEEKEEVEMSTTKGTL